MGMTPPGCHPRLSPGFFWGGVKLTWTRTQVRVARTDTRSCRLGSVHFTYYTCIYKYIHTRPLGHEEEEGAELRGSRPAGRGLTPELPEQRWGKDETNPGAVPGPPSPFPRGCDPQLGATLADLVTKATPGSPSMSRVRELNPARAGPSRARPGRIRREPLSSPALLLGTQSHACVAVPLAGGHCPIPLSHAWGLKQRGKDKKEGAAEPGSTPRAPRGMGHTKHRSLIIIPARGLPGGRVCLLKLARPSVIIPLEQQEPGPAVPRDRPRSLTCPGRDLRVGTPRHLQPELRGEQRASGAPKGSGMSPHCL